MGDALIRGYPAVAHQRAVTKGPAVVVRLHATIEQAIKLTAIDAGLVLNVVDGHMLAIHFDSAAAG